MFSMHNLDRSLGRVCRGDRLDDSCFPTQSTCFFAAETQEIEESAGALDVFEYVPNVGAGGKEGVDRCDQFALVCESTLLRFGMSGFMCRPGTDTRYIPAASAVEDAQQVYDVSTAPGLGRVLGRRSNQARRRPYGSVALLFIA